MIRKPSNLQNSAWNLANILAYPIAFLATTAFFINRLGENVFGEWMLINSYVFIAVHVAGFGLPNSITAYVAEAIGRNNEKKLHAYINASSRLLGRLTALTLFLAVLMTLMLYLDFYFFSEYIWKTLIVATLLIATKFPELLYQSIFKGYEHYKLSAIYNIATRMTMLVLQFFLVLKGYSLLSIFVSSLAVSIVFTTFQGFEIYRKLRGYKLQIIKPLPERKQIYHFGFWNWIQTNIDVASFQLDRFLVAYFLGTATVTYYVLAATIANHLHMAFTAVVGWLLPKITRMKASLKDTRMYFHTIRAFSVGFSLLAIICLYAVSKPLLTLWLGPDKYEKIIDFFRLFLAFEAFLILSIVPKLYLNGIKSLKFITVIEFPYKSAMVVGMVAFFAVMRTGESLIIGQIAALLIFMPIEYFMINQRILKENPFRETIMAVLPSLFIAIAILSPFWVYAVIFVVVAALIFWRTYLNDKYFNYHLLKE